MSTKTMRLPPRRVLTPTTTHTTPAPNKRKERDDAFDPPKPSSPTHRIMKSKPGSDPTGLPSHLLAGYLAHEFLTRGTLFGQPWDPREGPTEKRKGKGEAEEEAAPEKRERYVEVADLLKESGPHLPGIVNPTQLARFLHL